MNSEAREEKRLFEEAVELPAEERVGFLKGACRDRPELFDRVFSLLEAFADDSPVLPTLEGDETLEAPPAETEGMEIGRYKLLQQIGEGGMGVVYMAEQLRPVKRKVALKIIKLGMDTKQVVARFEAERQALALMDHPNIAKVLDAGATETGRPYFVMELVRGVSVTEYCRKNKLKTADRLDLFIAVSQAIQHAHQKGIIHRDIKPSNVLVTMNDGVPHPMVIDFGIAKATNHTLTEKTLFTNYAQMIGTPAYMSPEQAEMSKMDVDTRTDVYSLGVLLYELLTGTTPFPEKTLMSKGYGEMQRIIAEQEPDKPSTRLRGTLATAAESGESRPREIDRETIQALEGDLDWIIMRCLEKDRTRRYETVNGLVADLRRHLNNEPVTAAAPTFRYQLQKLYRRNRPVMRIALCSAVLLLMAAVVSVFLAIRAQQQAQRATREMVKAGQIGDVLTAALNDSVLDPVARGKISEARRQMKSIEEQVARFLSSAPQAELKIRIRLIRYSRGILIDLEFAKQQAERGLELLDVLADEQLDQSRDLLKCHLVGTVYLGSDNGSQTQAESRAWLEGHLADEKRGTANSKLLAAGTLSSGESGMGRYRQSHEFFDRGVEYLTHESDPAVATYFLQVLTNLNQASDPRESNLSAGRLIEILREIPNSSSDPVIQHRRLLAVAHLVAIMIDEGEFEAAHRFLIEEQRRAEQDGLPKGYVQSIEMELGGVLAALGRTDEPTVIASNVGLDVDAGFWEWLVATRLAGSIGADGLHRKLIELGVRRFSLGTRDWHRCVFIQALALRPGNELAIRLANELVEQDQAFTPNHFSEMLRIQCRALVALRTGRPEEALEWVAHMTHSETGDLRLYHSTVFELPDAKVSRHLLETLSLIDLSRREESLRGYRAAVAIAMEHPGSRWRPVLHPGGVPWVPLWREAREKLLERGWLTEGDAGPEF